MGDMVDGAITFEEALAMTKGMKLQESGERPLTSNRPAGDLQVEDLPLQLHLKLWKPFLPQINSNYLVFFLCCFLVAISCFLVAS